MTDLRGVIMENLNFLIRQNWVEVLAQVLHFQLLKTLHLCLCLLSCRMGRRVPRVAQRLHEMHSVSTSHLFCTWEGCGEGADVPSTRAQMTESQIKPPHLA